MPEITSKVLVTATSYVPDNVIEDFGIEDLRNGGTAQLLNHLGRQLVSSPGTRVTLDSADDVVVLTKGEAEAVTQFLQRSGVDRAIREHLESWRRTSNSDHRTISWGVRTALDKLAKA